MKAAAFRTRFAPSPSGAMHVGHLYAALEALQAAQERGGQCLLRVEDIDSRCTPAWEAVMMEELAWLGLRFDGEVLRQSERMPIYGEALAQLKAQGLLYPCFCTRAEMREQMLESGRAPHSSLGYQYEGRCRHRSADEVTELLAKGAPHAWRLDMQRAQELVGCPSWVDEGRGVQHCTPSDFGDVVLARKEFPASYHLCVVVDDAAQGISLVTRGEDLFEATHIHCLLQKLLRLPTPHYAHHALLLDAQGKRLAKRDGARSIESLRLAGYSPAQLRQSLQTAIARGGIWQLP